MISILEVFEIGGEGGGGRDFTANQSNFKLNSLKNISGRHLVDRKRIATICSLMNVLMHIENVVMFKRTILGTCILNTRYCHSKFASEATL